MKKLGLALLALPFFVSAAAGWLAPAPTQQERAVQSHHATMLRAAELKWGPASAKLPRGAQMAVLDGEPQKRGVPFTIRVRVPDGYSVPPHTHPTDEHLTVIQGTILLGMARRSTGRNSANFPPARTPPYLSESRISICTRARPSFSCTGSVRTTSSTSIRPTIPARAQSGRGHGDFPLRVRPNTTLEPAARRS
jgi:hypothetical protein